MTDRGDAPRGDDPASDGSEPVGSVGEEAARLFGALTDLARDPGGPTAGWSGLASHAAQAASEGIANGAPECRWCPVCRVVHAVRETTTPEVRAHLGAAAASLAQAAAAFLDTPVPRPSSGGADPDETPDRPEEAR